MTEIKNFIPTYPNVDDDNLIYKISHLKEFADLKIEPPFDPKKTKIPTPLNHQELQARYFAQNTPYKKGILAFSTGTGKTFAASLIVERFKKSLVDGKLRKPALIFVANAGLRNNMINEIINVATHDVYTIKNKIEDKESLIKMQRAIAQTYDIVTYGELLEANKFPKQDDIIEHYSNRVVIIDEAQNFRMQPGKTNEDTMYNNLWKLLHWVKHCRILLLTATPIWDQVYDIASILNLLLSEDDQLPVLNKFTNYFFDKEGYLIPEKALELKNKMKGMFSYIRSSESTAIKREIGVTKPWLKFVTVYPSAMSEFQAKLVKEASKSSNVEELLDIKKGKNAFYSVERDVSNCVYPVFDAKNKIIGGAYGVNAFEKYAKRSIEKPAKQGEYTTILKFTPELKAQLSPSRGADKFENLRKYSAKFATIIEMLLDPNRKKEKVFIYLDVVNGSGGVLSLALILQLWGFSWINSASEMKKYAKSGENKEEMSSNNFTTITSEKETINTGSDINKIMKIYNRPDNRYGKYIRIIIGSKTISQGYTLKDTRQGHLISAPWNLSSTDQSMGRIFRVGSHDNLPKNERYINWYRHVSVNGYYGEGIPSKEKYVTIPQENNPLLEQYFSKEETVDIRIYKLAEKKEFYDTQIYRLIKEMSWDCALTYKRNVLPNDKKGSRDCNFQDCNYECFNYNSKFIDKKSGPKFVDTDISIWEYKINKKDIDSSNFNLLYSQNRVKYYIGKIINTIFRKYFVLSLKSIITLTKGDEEIPILLQALNYMINRKTIIHNSYGFISYLKEKNNVYFLVENSTYSVNGSVDTLENNIYLPTYSGFPLITEKSNLEDIIDIIQYKKDEKMIKNFVNNPNIEDLETFSYPTKIIILEKTFELQSNQSKKTDKENELIKIVMNVLGKELYHLEDGSWVHNMYNTEFSGTSFFVTKKSKFPGKMRVFNVSNQEWEYLDPYFEEEYLKEINKLDREKPLKFTENNEGYEKYKMYGILDSAKGTFKIYDNREGNARIGGKSCIQAGFKAKDLINIFHHLNHLPYKDEMASNIGKKSKTDLINFLKNNKEFLGSSFSNEDLENISSKKLRRLYTLFDMKKDELCASIQRFFSENNLLERI